MLHAQSRRLFHCRDYYENTLHYFKHQLKADLEKPMQW